MQASHILRRRRDGRINRMIGLTNIVNDAITGGTARVPDLCRWTCDFWFLRSDRTIPNGVLSGSSNYVFHGRISSCFTLWLRRDLLQLTVTVQSVTPSYSTHHVDGAVPIVIWHASDCVVVNGNSHHRTSTQRFTAPHCIH